MATELAKAYVQIIPSAKGIRGNISKELGGEAESAGKSAGSKIASGIKGMIVAAGIGAAVKAALMEGADLQQSIGGIETLFGAGGAKNVQEYATSVGKSVSEVSQQYELLKQSESTMIKQADDAWRTAGLSANDYMQTSTSFAASLLSSLDGDTNAAAMAANNAVIAMSDNANKMGTEMQSIQNAYQGFAKQNYTLLDNLKLGYGGTKGEMERLLQDAEKLTGKKYNLDNLADVYAAISVIQDNLGITGTTAKEAEQTFSGSLAAMKSAGKNVLANLTLGRDVAPSLEALGQSVSTFIDGNLLPMVQNLLSGLPAAVGSLIPMMASLITELIGYIPELLNTVLLSIPALLDALSAAAPQLLALIPWLLMDIGNTIIENLDSIVQSGMNLLTALVDGILAALPMLIAALPEVIQTLVGGLLDNMPFVMNTGIQLINELIFGILENLPALVSAALEIIIALGSGIMQMRVQLFQAGWELLRTLIYGVIENLPQLASSAGKIIVTILTALGKMGSSMLSVGKDVVSGIWNGICSSFNWLKGKIEGWVGDVVGFIKEKFQIGSPSKLLEDEVGKWLPPGVARGVDKNSWVLKKSMQKLKDAAMVDINASMAAPVIKTDAYISQSATKQNSFANDTSSSDKLDRLIVLLSEFFPSVLSAIRSGGMDIGTLVDALTPGIDAAMGEAAALKLRGV